MTKAWADMNVLARPDRFPRRPTHPDHYVSLESPAEIAAFVCCNVLSFEAKDPTTVLSSCRHDRFVDSVLANPFSSRRQSLTDMAGPMTEMMTGYLLLCLV